MKKTMNNKYSPLFLVLILPLLSFAKGELDFDEGFILRCEAVVGENPDKLVITQEYNFSGIADKPINAVRFTKNNGQQVSINLNKNKYIANQHYLRIEAEKPALVALSVVNDGLEEVLAVEYSAKDKKNNRMSLGKYNDNHELVLEASGEAVECSIVKLKAKR